MEKKVICAANAPKAVGPYSQAIQAGETLYVSGQLPVNPADGSVAESIEDQTRQSLANLNAILSEAGMGFGNVVKTTVLLDDIKHAGDDEYRACDSHCPTEGLRLENNEKNTDNEEGNGK